MPDDIKFICLYQHLLWYQIDLYQFRFHALILLDIKIMVIRFNMIPLGCGIPTTTLCCGIPSAALTSDCPYPYSTALGARSFFMWTLVALKSFQHPWQHFEIWRFITLYQAYLVEHCGFSPSSNLFNFHWIMSSVLLLVNR